MRRISPFILTVSLLFFHVLGTAQLGKSVSQRKYWIFFSDKGPLVHETGSLTKNSAAYIDAASVVQPRALARRAKVLPSDQLLDYDDVPINQNYIQKIARLGGRPVVQSRWLNAASFYLTDDRVQSISRLPMVTNILPVRIVHFKKPAQAVQSSDILPFAKATSLDYGLSAAQVDAINVPPLHSIGITGKNIIVGMLDSGFRWRAHESLYKRHVIAEHDFIFNRDTVSNGPRDSSYQDEHGTLTFSTLAGYMPGKLIGPAFDASFILAETEWVPGDDFSAEEDYWAAGIEWEESLGADVVSSSVGYNTFSDTDGYTWEHGDFNGRTSVTARAAVRAARLGVVVCTGIGNEGNGDGVTGTMLTPGDADSIFSVGALRLTRELATFSSTGPTNDGRIKPDVVAPGASIYCANHSGFSSYFYQQGVSVASPLTSGSAALILSARPELTPMQVINAVRSTADRALIDSRWSSFPNNFVGWGLVNAFDAALSFGPIFSNSPVIESNASVNTISTYVMSKFGINPDSVLLYYARYADSAYSAYPMALKLSVRFSTSGLYSASIPSGVVGTRMKFFIEARDSAGNLYRSPAPILDSAWSFNDGGTPVPPSTPALYQLKQNFPNPFNPSTTITTLAFDTPAPVQFEIVIYNVLGQKVRSLYTGISSTSGNAIRWDGKNDRGNDLPSGTYLCRMITPVGNSTTRMMLIR
jgi:serine protease AprX